MKSANNRNADRVRERLQQRRAELEARSSSIGSDLRGDSNTIVEGFADHATAHANDDVLKAIRGSAQIELDQIDQALRRIEDGRYGRCESCGVDIGQQRLDAVPYATSCVNCAV